MDLVEIYRAHNLGPQPDRTTDQNSFASSVDSDRNPQPSPLDIGHWTLDVGCWMFIPSLQCSPYLTVGKFSGATRHPGGSSHHETLV